MPPRTLPGRLLALTAAVLCLGDAKELLFRKYDQFGGRPMLPATSVAQDADGFLWIGTFGGLVRFDGAAMVPWARKQLAKPVNFTWSSPRGEVLVLAQTESTLLRVVANGVEPAPGPDGKPFERAWDVQFTENSGLWVSRSEALYYRSRPGGAWLTVKLPEGASPTWLDPGLENTVLVSSRIGLWRAHASGAVERIRRGWTDAAAELPDGTLFVSHRLDAGRLQLLRIRGGVEEVVHEWLDQHPRFVVRGDTLWIIDVHLIARVRAGGGLEKVPGLDGWRGGEGGFVDREGSLWVAYADGLLQFPEPDVELWAEPDGLPPAARYLAENRDGLWVSTWAGLGLLRPGAARFEKVDTTVGNLCVDRNGTMWNGTPRVSGKPAAAYASKGAQLCASSNDGTLWLGAPGLYRTSLDGKPPAPVALPAGTDFPNALLEDSRGRIWISDAETVCWAPISELAPRGPAAWACSKRAGALSVIALAEAPSGSIWVGTIEDGLWSFDTKEWKRIPGSLRFPSRLITRITPSRRGGLWILSPGQNVRVMERPGSPDGFEIVESLSNWHGAPAASNDILEQTDGSLWLTSRGAVHLPARVRDQKLPAPNLRLTDILVDGDSQPPGSALEVPAGSNNVEIAFAALSFRDRSLLRLEYRLSPNAPWTPLRTTEPTLRLINLGAGDYSASLRVSLDGATWTESDAPVRILVMRPWYQRWPALLSYAAALALALAAAHRMRVRFLLRLEQERHRIAMDLHDELGSGLGSIGILSGLAASASTTDAQRREFSQNIAVSAAELSVALTEILWTLRPGRADLGDLVQRMVRRGETLFPGESPRFEFRGVHGVSLPSVDLATRRNLALIVDEALHNAAKHASARSVVLTHEQVGEEWEISVTDDGVGVRNGANGGNGGGMGLENMRQRAATIGARVWLDEPGEPGCRVRIRFRLPESREP